MPYKFEIYRDKKNEFRFRFVAPNGEKMFASEGYVSKASAKNTIKSIVKQVAVAAVEDVSKVKPKAAAPKAKKAKAKKATAKKAKATKAKTTTKRAKKVSRKI